MLLQVGIEVTIAGSAAHHDSGASISASRSPPSNVSGDAQQTAAAPDNTSDPGPDAPSDADGAPQSATAIQASAVPGSEPAALTEREPQADPGPPDLSEGRSDAPAIEVGASGEQLPPAVEENAAQPAVPATDAASGPSADANAGSEPAQIAAAPALNSNYNPSAADITALIAQGDRLIIEGDVASARLLYARAANAADGRAALRLGESYDSAFLARAHLSGVRGDATTAARWYRRARDLGINEAEALLQAIARRQAVNKYRWRPIRANHYWDWDQ